MSDPEKANAPGLGTEGAASETRNRQETGLAESIAANADAAKGNTLSVARGYLARGMTPIRLRPGSKEPKKGSTHDKETVTAENAERLLGGGEYNLGLRLGPDFGDLVDFDLDWPEARRLAEPFLFALARFGRDGARGSHYMLRCTGPIKTMKYDLPALKGMPGLPEEHACCVLEVRASGHTMAPPSIHPNGSKVTWERDAPLIEWDADEIKRRAGLLAFLSLVARFYPPVGSRDDFCMALSGTLLTAGLSEEEAGHCVVTVADAAGDEEAGKRDKTGATALKIAAGDPVTGLPRVVEMMGLPEGVIPKLREWLGMERKDADDDREQVVYSANRLHETIDAVDRALLASGLPIYQQQGRLVTPVRLDRSEGDKDTVTRPAGALVLKEITAPRLGVLLTRAASFRQRAPNGGTFPRGVPEGFPAAYLSLAGEWRVRVLRGVVGAPTLRPDGSVVEDEGYDPATGLILDFGGVAFAPVPDRPSEEDARTALDQLKDVISGFPFVDDAARSVALPAMLTGLIRRSLPSAPLHGLDAPTFGTGKSLLADVVAILATGAPEAVKMTQGKTDEENEKRLLSVLMQGDAVVCIDNILRPLSGDALATILTSEVWQGRVLGKSKHAHVSTQALFLANGNNLVVRDDLVRRTIVSRMDAGTERPQDRVFDRDLKPYVRANRAGLVVAGLTVLRAFAAAGYPTKPPTPMGSFEDWSRVVRGALLWLGEADPCDTLAGVAAGDEGREEIRALIEAWEKSFVPVDGATAGTLIAEAGTPFHRPGEPYDAGLHAALNAVCPSMMPIPLGRYLGKINGRIVGGKRIVRQGGGKEAASYRIEAVSPGREGV